MPINGRRIGARSRHRSGNLMASDGELADGLDPTDPGDDPNAGETEPPFIDIDVSIGL